jgi:uncharacterized lipoprotein YmbA
MRTASKSMILILTLAISSCAAAQTAGQIQSVFRQVIGARRSIIDSTRSIRPLEMTRVLEAGQLAYRHRAWDQQTCRMAKLLVPAWDKPVDAAYREALIAQLSSRNPEYRSLTAQ